MRGLSRDRRAPLRVTAKHVFISGFTLIDYRAPLEELPDPLPIVPLEKPFDVTITPPGSKSITSRAYVLAALAEGESRIIRPLRAEDTDLLLDALCTLGAEAKWDGDDVLIKGVGGRFPRGGSINLGDGGTPTRFMIAAACLAAEPVVVDGSKRMRERPIAEGVEMLRQLGATIEYVEEEGRLPVRVVPSDSLKGGELRVGKTASSQFISAVMLIAPWLDCETTICLEVEPTSRSYVALTDEVLSKWGYGIAGTERTLIFSPQRIAGRELKVAPDASSAVYWWAAATLVPGSVARIPGLPLSSSQPDAVLQNVIHQIVTMPCFSSAPLPPIDAADTPDGAMTLATVAAAACAVASVNATRHPQGMLVEHRVEQRHPVTITGLHTLRVKETDRLAALANELHKVGCTVETTEDSISITPPAQLAQIDAASDDRRAEDADGCAAGGESEVTSSGSSSLCSSDPASARFSTSSPAPSPVVIETYNDHRMAMSFAILGLVRPGVSIRNPKCVAKSYPAFWRDFAKLYE